MVLVLISLPIIRYILNVLISYINKTNLFYIRSPIKIIRIINIIISGGTLWVLLGLLLIYNNNNNEYQYRYIINDYLSFGIDGLNLVLLILVNIIDGILLLLSKNEFNKSTEHPLETRGMAEVPNINRAVVGLINKLIILKLIVFLNFLTLDLITFFITFELTLIPLFLMITQYGSKYKYFLPRLEAAYRLFFYSLFGSIFMLMSIILFFILYQTTDYELLNYYITTDKHNHSLLLISWIFLFFAFLVKIPTFPMFSWLPYAHSDAPTPGSIILAGIILKLGTYGIIRYSLLMYKPLNLQGIYIYYKPLIFLLGYISIIYCSLIALRALFDLKKIIAFSSIVHMNFSLFGLFSDNIIGIFGGTFLIFTHAFISCALFLLIGIIYKRFHTRNIIYLKGLFNFMPLFSFFLLLFSFANLSLPFASSFISELFILISTFTFNPFITLLLLFSLIFSTGFALWFPLRILFGQVSKYLINTITHPYSGYNNKPKVLSCDLTKIEFYSLLLLFILTFSLSLFPSYFIEVLLLPLLTLI